MCGGRGESGGTDKRQKKEGFQERWREADTPAAGKVERELDGKNDTKSSSSTALTCSAAAASNSQTNRCGQVSMQKELESGKKSFHFC